MTSNRFAVRNIVECKEQLAHLYNAQAVQTGCTCTHHCFFVNKRTATMSKSVNYRNQRGEPMYFVEVR